jgi:uncharacterized RDD family membrane protein YckC
MTFTTAAAEAVTPAAIAQRFDLGSALVLRWLGTVTDLLLLGALLVIPIMTLGKAGAQAAMVVWAALVLLYYPIGEGLWGRTVGKLVTGLIVVDDSGRPPGIPKAIVRTLLRLIEVNPFLIGGIPAAIAVAASPRRQRLGDMAAQTYVLRLKDLPKARVDEVFS